MRAKSWMSNNYHRRGPTKYLEPPGRGITRQLLCSMSQAGEPLRPRVNGPQIEVQVFLTRLYARCMVQILVGCFCLVKPQAISKFAMLCWLHAPFSFDSFRNLCQPCGRLARCKTIFVPPNPLQRIKFRYVHLPCLYVTENNWKDRGRFAQK